MIQMPKRLSYFLPSSDSDHRRTLILILILGGLLRLLTTLELAWFYPPFFHPPKASDMHVYHELAQRLAMVLPERGAIFWNPLYYHLLGALYALAGPHILLPVLLQVALGCVTILCMHHLAALLFTPAIGLLAAGMAALYQPLVFHEQLLLIETIQTTCFSLFMVWLLRNPPLEGRGTMACGFFFGLLVLFRSNIALLAPALLWWLLRHQEKSMASWRRGLLIISLFVLGMAVAISPFTLKNYLRSGHFVLISTNIGETVYLGLHRNSPGIQFFPAEFTALQQKAATLAPDQAQQVWFDALAASYQGASPATLLSLLARKICLFWGAWEIPNNASVELAMRASRALRLAFVRYEHLGFLAWGILLLLAIRRRLSAAHKLLLGILGLYTLSVLPLLIHGRFRLVLMPILIPLAAGGLAELFKVGTSQKNQAAQTLLVFLLAALAVNLLLNYQAFLDLPLFGFPAGVRY